MACVMSGCKAHPGKISYQNQDISFHRFPRDSYMKQMWLNIICTYNQSYTHKAHHRVCSRHFEDKYLSKKDSKGLEGSKKILKLECTGPRLKKSAIPTLYLGNGVDTVEKKGPDKEEGWALSQPVKNEGLVLVHPVKSEGLDLTQPIKKESLDLSHPVNKQGLDLFHPVKTELLHLNQPIKKKSLDLSLFKSDPVKTEGLDLSHPVKKEILDVSHPVMKEEDALYIGVKKVESMLELEVPAIDTPAKDVPVELKKDIEKKLKIKNKKTRKRKPRTDKLSQIPLHDYPARVIELEKLLEKEKQKSNRRLMTVKALREKLRRMTLKTNKLQALLKLVQEDGLNGSMDSEESVSCLSHIGDDDSEPVS